MRGGIRFPYQTDRTPNLVTQWNNTQIFAAGTYPRWSPTLVSLSDLCYTRNSTEPIITMIFIIRIHLLRYSLELLLAPKSRSTRMRGQSCLTSAGLAPHHRHHCSSCVTSDVAVWIRTTPSVVHYGVNSSPVTFSLSYSLFYSRVPSPVRSPTVLPPVALPWANGPNHSSMIQVLPQRQTSTANRYFGASRGSKKAHH